MNAHLGFLQKFAEQVHRRVLKAIARDDEIIVLVLQWCEPEPVLGGNSIDGDAPICPTLGDGGGHGIVGFGLHNIARGLLSS